MEYRIDREQGIEYEVFDTCSICGRSFDADCEGFVEFGAFPVRGSFKGFAEGIACPICAERRGLCDGDILNLSN